MCTKFNVCKLHCLTGKAKTFMGVSLFIGIPMIGLAAYNAYKVELEHHHHIEEHGRTPFVAYPHLRHRTKVVKCDIFSNLDHLIIYNIHNLLCIHLIIIMIV